MELNMNSVKWTKRFSDTLEKAKGSFVVYWISSSLHKDVKTEGYVGVSGNLYDRVGSHISKCKKKSKLYPQEMIASLNSEEFNLTILYQGSEDYCYAKELELRKGRNIGWNRRTGGKGFRSHIDEKVNKAYRRLLNVCKTKGLSVCDEWLGFYGIENFNNFYCEKIKDTKLEIFLPETGEVAPITATLKTKKDFIMEMNRNLDFFGDGKLLANCEVAELLGLKPNTLTTQRKRGWSKGKIFLKAWYNGKD